MGQYGQPSFRTGDVAGGDWSGGLPIQPGIPGGASLSTGQNRRAAIAVPCVGMPFDEADLDRLLSPDYVVDLESLSMTQLRARRSECQEVEVALSYIRRLAQGRLDIVHAELDRRMGGGEGDLHDLVERLPEILSDHVHSPGSGHLPMYMAPDVDGLSSALDVVAGIERMSRLPELSEGEVRALAQALEEHETLVSARRRAIHQRIDILQEELVGRYKRGEASPNDLLR